jgi:metal-responsive CopG/Arc/MetJ family transcriptional regulator
VLQIHFRSSRKWCDEEREALIEAVKKHPSLYDTNSKSYKDITVKTNAKLEISHLFEDCTVEDVTTQWTQLVDKFRRVRKVSNIEDPTGTSAEDSSHVQLPQWDLYHTMSFLDQHIKQRT